MRDTRDHTFVCQSGSTLYSCTRIARHVGCCVLRKIFMKNYSNLCGRFYHYASQIHIGAWKQDPRETKFGLTRRDEPGCTPRSVTTDHTPSVTHEPQSASRCASMKVRRSRFFTEPVTDTLLPIPTLSSFSSFRSEALRWAKSTINFAPSCERSRRWS